MATSAAANGFSFYGPASRNFANFPAVSRTRVSSAKVSMVASTLIFIFILIELPWPFDVEVQYTGRTIMSIITSATMRRAFVGEHGAASELKSNMVMDG
ncbi:hypothetical protein, partial [Paraburkholderia sp. RL17-373-BIF-A]|uniref:hypothetical protein n=1 Tax=Paraburkholderia sp. RL17-373-BIF-A TaxID=3031629 RepID=UPI0038B8A2C0